MRIHDRPDSIVEIARRKENRIGDWERFRVFHGRERSLEARPGYTSDGGEARYVKCTR
jgi:hypothetical protein